MSPSVAEIDLAIRSMLTLGSTMTGCPAAHGGDAPVSPLAPCSDGERHFVDSNRTAYKLHGGTPGSPRVDEGVSAADVRSLF